MQVLDVVLINYQAFIGLLSSIFSLALLITSRIKKPPQVQFLVEFLIGALIVLFTPVYC